MSRLSDQFDTDHVEQVGSGFSNRSGSSGRLDGSVVENPGPEGQRDPTAPQGASTEREPLKPSELRAPVPFQTGAKVDESQYHSRVAFRDKKTRFRAQSLSRWEHWCRIHHVTQQDFFNALMEDGFAKLLSSGILPDLSPESGNPCGNLGTHNPAKAGTLVPTNCAESGNLSTHSIDLLRSDQKIDQEDRKKIDDDVNISSSSDRLFPSGNLGTHKPPEAGAEQLKEDAALAFYQAKTGNRVKPHDRKAYRQGHSNRHQQFTAGVAHVQLHLIRRGILESVEYVESCGEHVATFAYCLGAIHRLVQDSTQEQKRADDERIHGVRVKADQRGNQQPLPGTSDSADLGDMAKPPAKVTDAETKERIRRDLGYHGPERDVKASNG